MDIMKRLFKSVELQPGEGHGKMLLDSAGINKHFAGRPGSMMRLFAKVVEFTHADFFSAIVDGIAEMMKNVSEKLA